MIGDTHVSVGGEVMPKPGLNSHDSEAIASAFTESLWVPRSSPVGLAREIGSRVRCLCDRLCKHIAPRILVSSCCSPQFQGSTGKPLRACPWHPERASRPSGHAIGSVGISFVLAMLVVMGLGTTFAAQGAEELTVAKGETVRLKTGDGVPFGIWGTEPSYPAPTLFVFSATIEESLDDPYYRQCGNALAAQGFLLVSLDLPGHGAEHREGEAENLAAWRFRSDQGEDFVAPFVARTRGVLDHLIESGYTDPERVVACGTSRGGFMALQFAAAEPRIRATAAFAPVTNLMALREFDGATNTDFVAGLSLLSRAERLAGRSLWLIIGDRDARVGTDDCIAFARRVATRSLAQSKPADVTLIVQPEPKGHTTPKASPEAAAAWITEKMK